MSDLFVYLIKVNIALIIFCLGYYLVLRPLTFYVLNRVYLVSAILFATVYPLIDFEAILNRHQEIAQPVQVIILNWQAPVVEAVHDKWYWMGLVFWAGVGVLAIRFAMQLLSLYKLHRQSKPAQLHQYFIRAISGDINPFSFWNSIYINPENHAPEELKAILAHEQVHVSEWHTLDILLGEISTIFYWFNPGVWLMKRAIRENIEFITDQKILQSGSDPKAYQYSLLNVSFNGGHNAIVNHFNTSTIKKRIMMMNTKRSSPLNLTRYAFLVPAVVVLVLIFSVSKAEFKKQVTKGNALLSEVMINVADKIEPVTTNIAVVAKRSAMMLPNAISVLFTDSAKREIPVINKYTNLRDTTERRFTLKLTSQDTSEHGFNVTWKADSSRYTDTSKKLKEITVVGYGMPKENIQGIITRGDVMAPNGNIYFSGDPVSKAVVNGVVISTHKMTPEEMEKLQKAGTATIGPGGIIDISQQKVTKVRVNGVEMTSTSTPITNNTIQAQNIQNLSVDKDGVVHVSAQNLTYKDKDGTINTQGFSYNPNVINIKRAADTTNKPLMVVNGNVANAGLLNQNDIESLTVLKGATATSLYGDKAKNGAILITTKNTAPESFVDLGTGKTLTTRPGFEKMYDSNGGVYYHSPAKAITITTTPRRTPTNPLKITNAPARTSNAATMYRYGNSPNIFAGKLLIVDGKEMSLDGFSKIPADKIESVKRASTKELTKYGDKAKNGALIITTNK